MGSTDRGPAAGLDAAYSDRPGGAGRTRAFVLPRVADAPAIARRSCAEVCDEWGVPQLRDDCLLLVSELVTNAVLHGQGDIALELTEVDDGICVSVFDDEPGDRAVQHPDELTPSGRGLLIVDAVADRWGSAVEGERTRAWFELHA